MKLRDYQLDVYNKIKFYLATGSKKILVSAPTGFGKTILAHEICKNAIEKGNRVLFTSHRIQLAQQTKGVFSDLDPAYLQGNSKGFDADKLLLVATIQTLKNKEIEHPKIVIIDEVHYAYNGDLIQSLFARFPDAIFIGLSATPVDDNNYLLEGFDSIIGDYQTGDLIKLGFLTPFKVFADVKVDLSNVKIKGSDYDSEQLSDVVSKVDITNSVVENYLFHGEEKQFICFAVNKKHAVELKNGFINLGIFTEIIDADTKPTDRDRILFQLKTDEIRGVINIEILTAGFDEPTIGCVILAAPTKSWKKFIQCCGRGIRLNGPDKKYCILLDCGCAIEEHGMPDVKRNFIFGKKISRVIDRELDLTDNIENRKVSDDLPEEKKIYLRRIGSLLDLYEGKVYRKESELQEDVNSFLEKTDFFWWRQNSGKMYKDGRWIHFASKSGLPDNTVFYKNSSLFFGIELKLKTGRLTDHQKKTLPEMIQRGVLFFIAESVYDVYKIIEFVESNVTETDTGFIINKSIYNLFPREIELRKQFLKI